MVTHYSSNGSDSACGRSSATLVSTQVAAEVSCKSCQRSLERPAVAPMKKTPSLADLRKKPAVAAQPAAVADAYCHHTGWRARLAALPSRCRLPRGADEQVFV